MSTSTHGGKSIRDSLRGLALTAKSIAENYMGPDRTARAAVQNLETKRGIISGDDMMAAILAGTTDLDNRAAGSEHKILKAFVDQNRQRLSSDARAKWRVYEDYVQAAKSRGRSGIRQADMAQMIHDMKETDRPRHQETHLHYRDLVGGATHPERGTVCIPSGEIPAPAAAAGQISFTVSGTPGTSLVRIDPNGSPAVTINERPLAHGESAVLADGGRIKVSPDGKRIEISTRDGYQRVIIIKGKGQDAYLEDSAANSTSNPYQPPVPETNPAQTLQDLWDQTLQMQEPNVSGNTSIQQVSKSRKLRLLLQLALMSGNMDLAMLLLGSLETQQANSVAAGLMTQIRNLQEQRQSIANQMGNKEIKPNELQKLNVQAGDIGTEISLLQTFLQDVMSQKNEAQAMTSNFLKSKHDTAMGIIRNMG